MLGRRAVALIGLRRSGKTTVGRTLARRLGLPFADTDRILEERSGVGCGEFLSTRGEIVFRAEEFRAFEHALAGVPAVIATGGGLVETAGARRRLRESCWTLWLDVPPEVSAARARGDEDSRPPLLGHDDPLEEARAVLRRRAELYKRSAHARIDAARPPDEVVERCASALLPLLGPLHRDDD